jgi:hypothetical protein
VIKLRFPLVIAPLALALTSIVSSCSSVTNDAARVGDRGLSAAELDDLILGYVESGSDEGSRTEGPQSGDLARNLLSSWISTTVTLDLISEAGGEVTAADLAASEEELNTAPGFAEADQKVRELFILNDAASAKLASLLAPARSELADTYESGAAESGVVCVRAILTNDRETIDLAAFRLAAGESFADVASEVSVDPSAADGGVLAGEGGNACIDYESVITSVAEEFATALDTTAIGEVSAPFEIPGVGWAVVLPRPFDEVADDIGQLIGGSVAAAAIGEALSTVSIRVSAEYGAWDPATGTVVPVG